MNHKKYPEWVDATRMAHQILVRGVCMYVGERSPGMPLFIHKKEGISTVNEDNYTVKLDT